MRLAALRISVTTDGEFRLSMVKLNKELLKAKQRKTGNKIDIEVTDSTYRAFPMKIDAFSELATVSIFVENWETAIAMTTGLDKVKHDDYRQPLEGKEAIRVMAEYGAILYKCCFTPEGVNMAIVIWGLDVWICPSRNRRDGVFIEPYNEQIFGSGVKIEPVETLGDLNNFQARMDGWYFAALMMQSSPSSHNLDIESCKSSA
jgi:hypothetical protein